jgi:bacillithiol biosynthesis deacetylase BshB1
LGVIFLRDLRLEPVETQVDILAIAAHPDDIELTCGGTMIRMAEAGYRTGALDLTAGEMGTQGSAGERLDDSHRAAEILKLTWRANARMPDARLENTLAVRMTVAHYIRQLRPRVVILPYWEARHPDHYRTSEIGYEACFLAGLAKIDEDSEPHRPARIYYTTVHTNVKPSIVVDTSAQFEQQMKAVLAYRSQFADTPEFRERVSSYARFFGSLIGATHGEAFVVKGPLKVSDLLKP